MNDRYVITAVRLIRTDDGYSGPRQLPTFTLDGSILGIVSVGHAARIAADIVGTGTVTAMSEARGTFATVTVPADPE